MFLMFLADVLILSLLKLKIGKYSDKLMKK